MYVYRKKIYKFVFFLLDIIGSILFSPVRLFRRKRPLSFNRILLIRVDHIGDIVNATVTLEPLRKTFPEAGIDFLAPSWAAEILGANPLIDKLIVFDAPWFDRKDSGVFAYLKGFADMVRIMKKGRYDAAVDMRGDVRHIAAMFLARVRYRIGYGITGGGFLLTHRMEYDNTAHETDRNMALLRPLGVDCPPSGVRLYLSDRDVRKAALLRENVGIIGPYAILHTVPGHVTKIWSAEKFARLTQYLYEVKGLVVIIVGAAGDRKRIKEVTDRAGAEVIDISGQTELGVLGALLRGASLFVGVDSGPSHIAAAAGTPAVILFSGINEPAQWAPKGHKVRVVCPGKGRDLSSVSAGQVCRVVDEVLGR